MTPALILHIAGGGIGLTTGAVALFSPKGERLHRAFGTVFFGAMLTMSAMAAYLAVTVPGQMGNLWGGILTFYFVLTAWLTVRRKEGAIGRIEYGAVLVPLAAAVAGTLGAWKAVTSPTGMFEGYSPPIFYVFTGVGALAAAADIKVIFRGGISGVSRIARHLWRMCVGLFVASGSFFIGKQEVMPKFLHGSPILFVLAFAPLVLMIFWLVRIRIGQRFKHAIPGNAANIEISQPV